jgi:hypothetical protein
MKVSVLGRSALGFVMAAGFALLGACTSDPGDTPGSTSGAPGACGASGARKCNAGEACAGNADCVTSTCVAGACAEPSCKNGVLDGTETAVDCGGSCDKCDGDTCAKSVECASKVCLSGQCAPKGTKICGVGLPSLCPEGEGCKADADCQSDYCGARDVCEAPPADAHSDGRRNAGETGKDCGGAVAKDKPCPGGEGCKTSDDCEGVCKSGTCDAASATDGKKNGGETDIDCGGASAPKCATGKACASDQDCGLLACSGATKKCVVPTSSDGVQNGGESDVDCGGSGVSFGGVSYTAPRCVTDKACSVDADCATGACSPAGKCVARSCDTGESAGIKTCGTGEVGQFAAKHESCCRSLPLPTRGKRLDKYEVTAGRYRSFISAVGPNVRAWVANYVAANPASQLATMVGLNGVVGNLFPAAKTGPLNLVAHLGAIDLDNYNGIRGCYNGAGNYGHATYWQPDADIAAYGIPPRAIPRGELDTKPVTCLMPMMLVAFCAWDGGELATLADYWDAWPSAYPWGANDIGRPNYLWCNGPPGTGGWGCQDTSLGDNGVFYEYPKGINPSLDVSMWIAAPGRFPMDATEVKVGGESWMDFYGDLAEYTGDLAASGNDFCDFSAAPAGGATTCTRSGRPGEIGTYYTNIPRSGIIGRSWEGHNYGRGSAGGFPVTFQYGKFGGRCVRPTE